MAEETEIAWTRSTFNPWIGCSKVGPGCVNCYAEAMDARKVFGGSTHFGARVPRLRTKEANWNQVRKWNKQAPESEFAGRKGFWPVFCASLADVFDNEVPTAWRDDFWKLVRECQNLTFQVLTKRIGNVAKMLPPDWGAGYPNVWMGSTIVNQAEADRDIPKLLAVPAVQRFLSMEPLVGPVDLTLAMNATAFSMIDGGPRIDWVVVGGESGPSARPMHPQWARSLRDQCADNGVPYLFKQWGEWVPRSNCYHRFEDGLSCADLDPSATKWMCVRLNESGTDGGRLENEDSGCSAYMQRVGKKMAGRLLDGVQHAGFPHVRCGSSMITIPHLNTLSSCD